MDLIAVRATGFPMELLDELRAPELEPHMRAILDADANLDALAERLRQDLADTINNLRRTGDRVLLREASRALRRVKSGEPVPEATVAVLPTTTVWNDALAAREELITTARKVFGSHLERSRGALRKVMSRTDVQEALLLLSPAAYDAARRYLDAPATAPRTTRTREIERRLVSYLQRLCGKNETNSFFGSINYGTIDTSAETSLRIERGPQRIADRHVLPAQWMVETLARTMSADESLRPHLRPRRTSGRASGTLAVAVHERADGRRTVADIAAEIGTDPATVWTAVEELTRRRAVDAGPIVPPDLADPLAWLISWTTALPSDCTARRVWLPILTGIAQLLTAFAQADVRERRRLFDVIEERFTDVCGRPGRREGGKMYADRGLFFEECRGDMTDVVIGGRLARDLTERLEPVLHLAQTHGMLRWRRDQRQATALWRHLAGDRDEVPVHTYLQALADAPRHDEADELSAFEESLRGLVAERSDGHVANLTGSDLPRPALPDIPDTMHLTSLDVMLGATGEDAVAAGDYQLVIGEMHPQPLLWAFPTGHFLTGEQRASMRRTLYDAIAAQPGAATAATIAHTRSSKVYPYPLPGHELELRPRLATADATPVTSVRIRRRGDGVSWWAPEHGWLRLYAPLRRREDRLDPVAPFAFPALTLPTIDLGEHTPRIVVDGVILQRRRWKVPAAEFAQHHGRTADDFGHYLAAWRAKERRGLPARIYVKVAHETKPVHVDFADVLLVELLDSMARASEVLVCTEALPDPRDQLWLSGPEGRHCCEFRTIAWRTPE